MGMMVKNWDLERLWTAKPEIFGNKKLSVKLVYWLSRLQKDVEKRFKEYADARSALFEKYSIKNEDGSSKYGPNGEYSFRKVNDEGKVEIDRTVEVSKEMDELRQMVIEVTSYEKIKLDLSDKTLEGVLSPNDLTMLEPFVEIVEPKE